MRRLFVIVSSARVASLAIAMALSLLAPAISEAAEQPPTTILALSWFTEESFRPIEATLTRHLRQYNLANGRDFVFEFHQVRSQGDVDRVLAGRGHDAIVYTMTTSPSRFVVNNGTAKRHVFVTYSDPLAEGWISSYARPGGSSTGIVELVPIHEKRLDLLLRLMPRAKRIAVAGINTAELTAVVDLARQYGSAHPAIEFVAFPVEEGETAEGLAMKAKRLGVQAAYVPLLMDTDSIVDALFGALKLARVPAISERQDDLARGAILTLQVDRSGLRERTAHQLAQVLKGTPPAILPVHSPRTFRLAVNLDAAQALDIAVPRSLMRQANKVVLEGR